MSQNSAHQKLVGDLLLAVGSLPHIRIWPRQVGLFRYLFNDNKIRIGIPGESDIQGIMMPTGRFLALEVKTGSGKLSADQIKWKTMIEKYGGLHIIARSVEQVLAEIKLAQ